MFQISPFLKFKMSGDSSGEILSKNLYPNFLAQQVMVLKFQTILKTIYLQLMKLVSKCVERSTFYEHLIALFPIKKNLFVKNRFFVNF